MCGEVHELTASDNLSRLQWFTLFQWCCLDAFGKTGISRPGNPYPDPEKPEPLNPTALHCAYSIGCKETVHLSPLHVRSRGGTTEWLNHYCS